MQGEKNNEIININLDDIIPNRFQPRLNFDEKSLNELGASIKQHGVIQPVVVRPVGDKYEIIAGERRYKAASMIGLNHLPGIVMDLDDKDSAEVAVIENIQRKDLNPIEEAKSYQKILAKGYLTQENLGERLGKTQATIANKLRLLNLNEEVQNALLKREISERHARSLLILKNDDEQKKVLEQIISNKLTVKETNNYISSLLSKPEPIEFLEDGVELEKLKEEAEDISPPQRLIDINKLLIKAEGEESLTMPPVSSFPMDSKPETPQPSNRFIQNFEEPEVSETPSGVGLYLDDHSEVKINKIMEEPAPVGGNGGEFIDALEMVRKTKENIEKIGFQTEIEEFDFEGIYQILLKINKYKLK